MNTTWETQSSDYGNTYFSKFYAETTKYDHSAGLAIDAQHSQSDDCYVEKKSIEIEFQTREQVNNLISLLMEVRNNLPKEVNNVQEDLTCPPLWLSRPWHYLRTLRRTTGNITVPTRNMGNMNYEKLWKIAQMTPNACIGIEQAMAENQKFPDNKEYQELIDSLTPEEKAAYTEFIGDVNGLRWEIKSLQRKRLHQVLNMPEAEREEIRVFLNETENTNEPPTT